MATPDLDLDTLYAVLTRHARAVRRDRRLPIPPADSVTVRSPLCGSGLTLDAVIRDGRVQQLGYRIRACSLGQASTAIVAEHAAGLDKATLSRIEAQLRRILAGESTRSDWPELEIFALVKDVPPRHGSVLLPFQALEQLFDRAQHAETDPDGAGQHFREPEE